MWTVENLINNFRPLAYEPSDEEVNGATAVLAYVEELRARGVEVKFIERVVDAEGAGVIAFEMRGSEGGDLEAQFPGVPLEWFKRPADFADGWSAWQSRHNGREIFIQGGGYVEWARAVDAGVDALS